MKSRLSGNKYKILVIRIVFAFVLFSLHRLIFYISNIAYFNHEEIFPCFFYGLYFDASAIALYFSPFIIVSLLPFNFDHYKPYRIILFWLYLLAIIITSSLALLDSVFFHFTQSRSTSDLFNVISIGNDFTTLLWQYVHDFWFAFILLGIMIAISVIFFRITNVKNTERNTGIRLKLFERPFVFLLGIAVIIISIRGGFQLRPVSIVNAGEYVNINNTGLVLNTPFTMMKTIGKQGLKDPGYFKEKELIQLYNPAHNFIKKDSGFSRKNIVIIVLEGFSTNVSSYLKGKHHQSGNGFTPFLDSLMQHSVCFTNAYANGKRSIEAIPAVFCSLPTLMNEAYITSNYAGDKLNSIASLLKTIGYKSAFFHGGTNGTMGFEGFLRSVGFEKYFGRTEFNNEAYYDGKWGIYDEPFLQYTASEMAKIPEPFVSGIFTLSSHHPYKVSEEFLKNYKTDGNDFHTSIAYADHSLQKFFAKIKMEDWFNRTLFIITADHTSESEQAMLNSRLSMYSIPLLIFDPQCGTSITNETTVQQTDILPTILDYLHFPDSVIAFGESMLDSNCFHFAINYSDETYQLIHNDTVLILGIDGHISLFNSCKDPELSNDIYQPGCKNKTTVELKAKAIVQTFIKRITNNQLTTVSPNE